MNSETLRHKFEQSKALYWVAKQVYHWVRTVIVIIILAVVFYKLQIVGPVAASTVSILLSILLVLLVWAPNPATPAIGALWFAMPVLEESGL